MLTNQALIPVYGCLRCFIYYLNTLGWSFLDNNAIKPKKRKKLLAGPWFFLGPITLWFIIMCYNPQGLIDLFSGSTNSVGFIEGLANGLATKAGITATWAHMVAGDIFVTRWIWRKCLETNSPLWVTRLSIFFGVMLMPIGLGIFAINNFFKK